MLSKTLPFPWPPHRARLRCLEDAHTGPDSAQEDLAEARRLIEKHGYQLRKEELADAEAAAARL
jgi:hypothetical protein